MRPIDADALIEFCAERWIPLNIDAVNMQPTIQPVATDTNVGSCSEIPNSSDAINRQDAIDALDKRFDNIPMEQTAEILKLRKDLRELPTIQPKPQWIPVEKELPEPRIDVWVNSDLGQMVGYYDDTVDLWYGRDYLELIVNAWMPLPEAYKPNK